MYVVFVVAAAAVAVAVVVVISKAVVMVVLVRYRVGVDNKAVCKTSAQAARMRSVPGWELSRGWRLMAWSVLEFVLFL